MKSWVTLAAAALIVLAACTTTNPFTGEKEVSKKVQRREIFVKNGATIKEGGAVKTIKTKGAVKAYRPKTAK